METAPYEIVILLGVNLMGFERKFVMKMKLILGGLLSLSVVSVANATVYNTSAGFSGENRGAFNSSDVVLGLNDRWKVVDGNYQVRSLGAGFAALEVTRNYHIFDIPALAANEVVTGVTFTIPHSNNSYDSPDATETFGLFDIDVSNFADIRVATKGNSNDPGDAAPFETRDISILNAIYEDLGTGVSYGSFTSSFANNGSPQTVETSLNQMLFDAITTLGQAGGGDFGIGGAITSNTSFTATERTFRGTSNLAALSSLQITTTVVPVPAAVWLFGTGLLGMVGFSKRRTAK